MCCQDECKGCGGRRCVVVLVAVVALFFGISTLGAGITVLLVNKYDRSHRLGKVEDAVVRWNNPSSPATSWQQFEKLNVYAKFTPGVLAKNSYTDCANYPATVKLSSSDCQPNVYHEEAARFASVKQLAFCASVNYNDYQTCDLQVELLVMQPAASGNTTLFSKVPAIVGQQAVTIGMYDLEGSPQCSGKRRCTSDCKNKCSRNYGGVLSCGDLQCRTNAYVDNLAVKVAYLPDTSKFAMDYLMPDMGPASNGANALPKGYTWTPNLNNVTLLSESGPMWELERLAFVSQRPAKLTLTVRSSSDPWLAYMAATRGSGYFGMNMGAILGISISLIAVGSILILAVMIFAGIHMYGTVLYSRDSTRQPDGCFRAMAWRLAASLHSPPQPPQPPATSPVSQIVTAQPVAADGTMMAPAAPAPPGMYYTPMSYTASTASPAGSVVYPPPPPGQYASVTNSYPAGAPTASAGSSYYPPPPAAGGGTAAYPYPSGMTGGPPPPAFAAGGASYTPHPPPGADWAAPQAGGVQMTYMQAQPFPPGVQYGAPSPYGAAAAPSSYNTAPRA